MVSAGAANKKALGIDRNANPWSDIPLADVVWVAGANVAETFPITTSYIWRARDRGAKLIVQDPRVVPLARTADLFLGVRPGTDSALFGAVLHVLIGRDWLDHDFIDAHTDGFDEAAAAVAEMTPAWAAASPACRRRASSRPPSGGARRRPGCCSTPAASSSTPRASRTCSRRSTSGWPPASTASRAAASPRSPGRATARAGASTATSATSCPATATSPTPSTGPTSASVWGCDEAEIPGKGITAQEIIEAIHAGEIKGLLSICFNPAVSAPDADFTAEALDRLEFYAVIDFFLSETAHHADVVLPGSLHEEDEGTVDHRRGPDRQDQQGRRPARRGPASTGRSSSTSPAGSARATTSPTRDTEQIFEELRLASAGGTADYRGATWERIEDEMGLFWPIPTEGHPGTPRLFEGGRFYHPTARRASTPCRSASRPRWSTTSTRSGSPPAAS